MPEKKNVSISDGGAVAVRPLFLYEDDIVPFDDPGEFVFQYVLDIQSGQIKPVIHTLADFQEIPVKPARAREAYKEGSEGFDLWAQWTLFQAIVTHETERIKASEEHAHNVIRYILTNCLSEEDRRRIVTVEDLQAVLAVALVTEIAIEEVEGALASTFQGILEWAAFIASTTRLAERQGGSVIYSSMGSPDPASLAA